MQVTVGIGSALTLALITLPIAALVLRALGSLNLATNFLSQPVIGAINLSLGTTAFSVLIVTILGLPLAYALARYRFPFKRVLNVIVELPIVMPPVVAGLALLMAFGRRGLLGQPLTSAGITLPFSPAAVIIAQVFVSMPFFIRAAQVRFQAIPHELEDAASIDGADGWQTFWHITLPLSRRGLLIGLVLSWARALGEFGATVLFAGNLQGRTQTMPLFIYSALEHDIGAALWAGLLLIGVAVLALGVVHWLTHTLGDGRDPLAGL